MGRIARHLHWHYYDVLFHSQTAMMMMTLRIFLRTFLILACFAPILPCQALTNIITSIPLSPLESLPIQDQGRKKPFLIFAEEFLLAVSGTTSLKMNQTSFTPMQVVTALWLSPQGWENTPLILVKDKQLKQACELPTDQELFSFETLRDHPRLQLQILEAQEARNSGTPLSTTAKAAEDIAARMYLVAALSQGSLVRIIPNPNGGDRASWTFLPVNHPRLENLKAAYTSHNTAALSTAVAELKNDITKNAPAYYPAGMPKIHLELLYQALHPFRWAWIAYLSAGLLLLLFPSPRRQAVYPYIWGITLVGLLFQIVGFVCRVLIAGRPPVTNMYESVIWVAFGIVLFALIFESLHQSRIFLSGALPIATLSLILADSQPLILSDSIHPLTAVLQSNFWLTIHVLTITLSYAAFALAMGIAHIVFLKIASGRSVPPPLYNYIYRVLQIGVLLLACGTILGGVWANYSWGRFWDWDPKETWALITLLTYLIILHGRIAGKWNGFGLAVGAVIGFLSVLMAWYGVNFVLGTGLHSYGFGTGGFQYVMAAVLLDALFIIFAIVRHQHISMSQNQTRKFYFD